MRRIDLIALIKKRRNKKHYTKHIYHSFSRRFIQLMSVMLVLIMIHTSAMMYFENMAFSDGLWLSVTTLNTVGYGDYSSSTFGGRLSTIIFLYVFGISLLSVLIGEYMEFRINKRDLKLKGHWIWKMNDHILIINTPNTDPDGYLTKLVQEIRRTPDLKELPIQIVTRKYHDGLPQRIASENVVHCDGESEDSDVLRRANVSQAKYIFLLARSATDTISDSLTFDVLNRIQEIGTDAVVAAEVVVEKNRQRCRTAGANVAVRPVRAYPELLIRGITSPGTEVVLENLFSFDGTHMERIDCHFENYQWKQLVSLLMENNAGLPVAYIVDGKIEINPHPETMCSGDGLITMVYEAQEKLQIQKKVQACLSR